MKSAPTFSTDADRRLSDPEASGLRANACHTSTLRPACVLVAFPSPCGLCSTGLRSRQAKVFDQAGSAGRLAIKRLAQARSNPLVLVDPNGACFDYDVPNPPMKKILRWVPQPDSAQRNSASIEASSASEKL